MESYHRTHFQQHQQQSSPSPKSSKSHQVSSSSSSSSNAEQKRSKFKGQRSSASKQGSTSSLIHVGTSGGGEGGGGASVPTSIAPSPSHSTASSRMGTTVKNSIISSKSTSSNKSQSTSSIVLSNLLAEVGELIHEDDRPIIPGVPVRAACIRSLISLCIRAFDPASGEIMRELENFPQVLFLMHQWFCPSAELASLFITQFRSASLASCHEPSCPCHGAGDGNHSNLSPTFSSTSTTPTITVLANTSPSPTTTNATASKAKKMTLRGLGRSGSSSGGSLNKLSLEGRSPHQFLSRCKAMRLRASVCQALRFWIKTFPIHFDVDDRLQDVMVSFSIQLEEDGHTEWAQWLDLTNIPSYEWLRNHSVKESESSRSYRKVTLIFNHLEPDELAKYITLLETRVLRRITFQDFKQYAENGTLEDNPMLERSVSIFNGLSQWIQYVVLNRPTPIQRADVIAKFIHVAENLKKLQNFNSLMCVVGSLSHSVLQRLNKTMDCLSSKAEERKVLSDLASFVSASNNFRQYRKALSVCTGFKIPILGVHLKDLISLHTALPDNIENGLINFRKMTQLFLIFKELQDLQQSPPVSEANNDLINTLKVSLEFNYSEDELYELSLSREPRASNSISPTRGPGQQDNANGSYEKQVQAMVDAVFRNYDSNHDGFITRDEFQALSNNFPAIDAFFVLDENRDGMISKLELERYLRNRKNAGAQHNFHEQTYFKPTFCIHCSGLLWGLIKQGYKCRNCGVNAHKYCKDYMLHECKMGQLFYFPSPEPQAKRRGFAKIRKKSSSQSDSGSPPEFFNSLEQLSLSTESTEIPTSTSSCAIHVNENTSNMSGAGGIGGGAEGSHIKSLQQTATVAVPSSSSSEQETHSQHQTETNSRGTKKGLTSHLQSTPKGSRRLSSILSSSTNTGKSSSAPASPKLAGFSIPLLSPGRFFGHLSNSNSPSNPTTNVTKSPSTPPPPVSHSHHRQRHAQKSNKTTSLSNSSSPSPFSSTSSSASSTATVTTATSAGVGGTKSFISLFGSSNNSSSSPKEISSRKQKSLVSSDT